MSSLGSPPWMDKKLLELWLRSHYGEVTVTDFEVADAMGKGENYLSDMRRMVVRTKDGGSHFLVIKCRIEEGTAAKILRESNIFKKEKEMYGNTLPRIHALLQKAIPGSFETLAPKCIYACKSFLVLEDLSIAGFKMGERHNGLDLDHCLLLMRTLARFHAASVVLHQEDPNSMNEYNTSFFCEPSIEKTWPNFFSGMSLTLAEELDTWPEEWRIYAVKVRNLAYRLMQRVQETTRREETRFNVLNHGDIWVNNILFRGNASAVRMVDFQLAYFSTPAVDLHYFLTTSVTQEVRDNHTERLLQVYHSTLYDTLTTLGYTKMPPTLEELHEELDRKVLYGLFSLIAPYAVMQCEPECGFNFDAVLDTGSNPGPCMYRENYRKAVKWLLPIYDSKSAFDSK